ncbi:MAG: CBS domain-containing protein [Pirellulales bacterium]
MSLKWYRMPRMVVLKPNTPVLEAARAIEHNNIGAVIVHDKGRIVGLVTDRDLAVRVLGRGLDAESTKLCEVMTTPVTTLSPMDSHDDAIQLMQQKNIRRIPLVEEERIVGIVTLDDLLLDEAVPLDQLATVVEAQIGEGGPAASLRSPVMRRSTARAQATYGRMLNQLRDNANLETSERAETALEIVLGSIVQRLTPGEAMDLIAQLPSLLQPTLRALPRGPDKTVTRQTIEAELSKRLGLDQTHTWQTLVAVGDIVAQTVSSGQIDDVHGQLPDGLRGMFSSCPADVAVAAAL